MPTTPQTNSTRSSARTESSWFGTAPTLPAFQPLRENLTTEVVVGGGISGLTTACPLSKEGRKVVLLEDGALASGESGRTTAHLSNALGDHYFNLESLFGKDGARLAAESHSAAIDRIEKIVRERILTATLPVSMATCFCTRKATPATSTKSWLPPTAPASACASPTKASFTS